MFKKVKTLSEKTQYKVLIIFCIICIIIPFIVRGIIYFRNLANFAGKLVIIEGEETVESNFIENPGYISKRRKLFKGRSLNLSTPQEAENGYYAHYKFEIKKSGTYDIFIAGTPPGPAVEGSKWFSPYSITIDGKITKHLTEEQIKKEWPKLHQYGYATGSYYFTKAMTVFLDKGAHTLSININLRRKHDNRFTVYIDAFIIAPEGLRPGQNIGKIPKEIF